VSKIRILVADDIPQTRTEIQRLLSLEGHFTVVGEAGNGEEAVRLAAQLQPDVVLMDINMPGMDGITATQRITILVPQTAIIMVSIQGEHEYLKKAMLAGASEYLIKPFGAEELVTTIKRVVELQRIRQEQTGSGTGSLPKRRKMVAVVGPKGGVGRTTIAANLAIGLAQQAKDRVVLVDLDLQFGDIGLMLNLKPIRHWGELAGVQEDLDAEHLDGYLTPHFSGLQALLAPPNPQEAELVTPELAKRVLKALGDHNQWLVVDCAAGLNDHALDAMEMADYVLLVAGRDLASLKAARVTVDILLSLGLKAKAAAVFNGPVLPASIPVAEAERALGLPVAGEVEWDPNLVLGCLNKGIPVVLAHANTGISRSLAGLVEWVRGETKSDTVAKKSLVRRILSL